MSTRNRTGTWVRSVVVVVVSAAALLGVGAVLSARSPAPAGPVAGALPTSATAQLEAAIVRAQDRLRRVPADYPTWAALGSAYLELARITADPTIYAQAEQSLAESLSIRPAGNAPALTGLGALANARHDFAEARALARRALRLNRYDASAYGVLADAETQLGNAEAATEAIQRMLDLRPGLPAYARASYDLEQHGRVAEAADLLERALAAAFDPADIAFCRYQLGQLAWHSGDLDEAGAQFTAGAAADPSYLPLREGLARVAAATGDVGTALAGYAEVAAASPTPEILLSYAELLRSAGREGEAEHQLALAEAAHELFVASGGTDDLTGAELAIAGGRPAALSGAGASGGAAAEALDLAEEAVKLAGREWRRREFADVADTLAWALHLAGRDEAAIEYAERAGASGARNAEYAYHLGMIELSLGDSGSARGQLALALEINPYFSVVDAPRAAAALAGLE